MKTTWTALLVACILVLVALGCKKQDPIDPDGTVDEPETSIAFTCKDTIGLPGIFVGIALQTADCEAGVFLRSGTTDGLGKIKFSSLAPGSYCYECARTTTSGVVKRSGQLELAQDEELKKTVVF